MCAKGLTRIKPYTDETLKQDYSSSSYWRLFMLRFNRIPTFITLASIFTTMFIGAEILTSNLANSQELAGKIYTIEEQQPWAEAFAVKNGRFVAVGKTTDLELLTLSKIDIFSQESWIATQTLYADVDS